MSVFKVTVATGLSPHSMVMKREREESEIEREPGTLSRRAISGRWD